VLAVDLSGRTALITGGGRGLGGVISTTLAAAGARVVVNYARHPEPARATVAAIEAAGGAALALRADVSHPADVDGMLAAVEEGFGPPDILVSNAALGLFRQPGEFDLRGVSRTFEISAWPLLDLAGRMAPGFERAGFGRVIAISSLGSRRAITGYAAVGMAKGAVEAAVPYLADHLGAAAGDITANAVVPAGLHDGAHTPAHALLTRRLAELEGRAPGGRYATMAEVARVVAFLASDLASGVNGQSIVVDRGWSVL
jgi:enoyl-[acyl-carrier protein] reductase III